MSSIPAPRHSYSYAEYLIVDEMSSHKNEYFDGEIYAMAGGSVAHAALAAEIITVIGNQLRGRPCRIYTADLRIRVKLTGLATYPDVSVICGPLEEDPEGRDTAINPTVLVEVLSDGTESYDRGEKREHYFLIPSLREYVVVSQREKAIEVWRRVGEEWTHEVFGAGTKVTLAAIGCEIDVGSLYAEALG